VRGRITYYEIIYITLAGAKFCDGRQRLIVQSIKIQKIWGRYGQSGSVQNVKMSLFSIQCLEGCVHVELSRTSTTMAETVALHGAEERLNCCVLIKFCWNLYLPIQSIRKTLLFSRQSDRKIPKF
jgi:hypothetical protein